MPEHEVFQMQTLEVTRLADDDLSTSREKNQFDLEKLKDTNLLETFQAIIGGKFEIKICIWIQ